MKRFLYLILPALLAVYLFVGASAIKKTFPMSDSRASVFLTNSYANSTSDTSTVRLIDTLLYIRSLNVSAVALSLEYGDSVSIVDVIMRRVIGTTELAVQAGDTLYSAFAKTAAGVSTAAITLLPLCDAYRFYVTYDTAANGVTSPTMKYVIQQQNQ